jgi:hypothetical protein
MEIPQESITLKSITLTKADAATRQIDAAIEALLHDRFDIAITLAGAAEDMIAAALFQGWVMGYISAVNGNAPGPPNITQGYGGKFSLHPIAIGKQSFPKV